jgi:hypothetical protein
MWLLAIPIAAYLGYKLYYPAGKAKLDESLGAFQKVEVYNALKFINDPQVLNVMAAGMLSSSPPAPIAAELIRKKMVHLQHGGTNANFDMPDYDFSA